MTLMYFLVLYALAKFSHKAMEHHFGAVYMDLHIAKQRSVVTYILEIIFTYALLIVLFYRGKSILFGDYMHELQS